MDTKHKNCQSCGMPMKRDEKGGGTNVDGSRNGMYCSHCFANGKFIAPDLSVGATLPLVTNNGLQSYHIIGLLADKGNVYAPEIILPLSDAQTAYANELASPAQSAIAQRAAKRNEIYGCLIFNNGWVGPDRSHGHARPGFRKPAVERLPIAASTGASFTSLTVIWIVSLAQRLAGFTPLSVTVIVAA